MEHLDDSLSIRYMLRNEWALKTSKQDSGGTVCPYHEGTYPPENPLRYKKGWVCFPCIVVALRHPAQAQRKWNVQGDTDLTNARWKETLTSVTPCTSL